jgi:(4-(4-[2-(gamma-L-glutamylamino)ethyl]phenoxymethyl)furan-2-yl)methanamine synthase
MARPTGVVGWDIGGVNTKGVRLTGVGPGSAMRSASFPLEVQRRPHDLASAIAGVAHELGAESSDLHAVTMTAELSQAFRTKRQGVGFVLDALSAALPGAEFHVYTVDGRFVSPGDARTQPLAAAAANWAATASLVARSCPTCILIDIGTTTADLIPIVAGKVVAHGSTDPERLLSGELVYTGALRTPAEAVARRLPLWGGSAGVAADGFALTGDVHLWLGQLQPEDYTCATPDGRPASREFAGERLARLVCADGDMLSEADIQALASALAEAQIGAVLEALMRIRERRPDIATAVVAGLGDFIAVAAACRAGLSVVRLADRLGQAARVAPAAAVGWLLWQQLEAG